MGHTLGNTLQDLLVRWHRMRGEPTLWIPGVDHAGLATLVEVRRRLARDGVVLEELSRAEILDRVGAWVREHEALIRSQWAALGISLDLTRFRYTMDPGMRRATRTAFVRLYEAGLVYRGDRIVNWDPKLKTAISDLEVVYTEEPATLLYLRYPWADGSPGGLTVATVRPETIFGDVAVAVHPDDARHAGSVGKHVRVPLTDRTVPIIADAGVDPTFGNGALKLTPRHDTLDFEIARRHPELPTPPSVLDLEARLTSDWVPERFLGLARDEARAAVTSALREAGLVEREESRPHSIGRSERSDAVIEPLLSTQWFVRMPPLAATVLAAVRRGEVTIHPERWNRTFHRWMEELEDWCISRQIAWGHPIPVLYCEEHRHEIVALEPPTACPNCGSTALVADPDVLDTWFTSWMWPFASLGWPESTPDLAHYFPTTVLVTGRDIMFFWVARMMMASYFFLGIRPYADIYFTGMVRDSEGRRMSKHLGNSPDPNDVIREWGADTVRFALLFPTPTDQDASFRPGTLEGGRNFLTKLWNLARLLLQHTPADPEPPDRPPSLDPGAPLEDRWILSRWHHTAREVDEALAAFEFTRAAGALHNFLWHDLADRYVEVAKAALAGDAGPAAQRRTRSVFAFVLERSLRQLHPMVPHVTEELWHAVPHRGESLLEAAWPQPSEAPEDSDAERAMEVVFDSVRALRNLRAENHLAAEARPSAWAIPTSAEVRAVLAAEGATVVRLAQLQHLELLDLGDPRPERVAPGVTTYAELFVALPTESSPKEQEGLKRERQLLEGILEKTQARLRDRQFRSNAPPAVVQQAEAKANELQERLRRIDEHLGDRAHEEGPNS